MWPKSPRKTLKNFNMKKIDSSILQKEIEKLNLEKNKLCDQIRMINEQIILKENILQEHMLAIEDLSPQKIAENKKLAEEVKKELI